MMDLLDEINMDMRKASFISYADGLVLSAEQNDANEMWQTTVGALSEIGL